MPPPSQKRMPHVKKQRVKKRKKVEYDDDDCCCSCDCCCQKECIIVMLAFAAILFVIIEAIIAGTRPESFPTHLVLPTNSAFTRIEAPNTNVPHLYALPRTQKYLRVRKVEQYLPQIKEKLRGVRERFFNASGPDFPYDPNSTGIITTCKLGPICVSNLHHLFETMNVTVPVELWLERSQTSSGKIDGLNKLFENQSFSIQFFEDYEERYFEVFGRMESFRHGHFYYLKVMAMVCSKFQNVIFVDDDAYLLRDPLFLLERMEKEGKGGLFWHDMYAIHPENLIWNMLDIPVRQGLSGESGVVIINKEVAWRGLYFAAYMNNKQNVFYRMVWGDKDTFFLAFEYMNQTYSFVPYAPNTIGNSRYQFSFVQPDLDGVAFFIHLVSGKRYFTSKNRNQMTRVQLYDPNHCHILCGRYLSFFVEKSDGCKTENVPYKNVVGNVPMYITRSYWQAVDELNNMND